MKKFIKWMRRHPNTCSFFINFLATVLGIVLTLGTTMWYDRHEKAEASEALVEHCLVNMEERLVDLDHVVEFYDQHIKWFSLIEEHPLDSLTEDQLEEVYSIISSQKHLITNRAYEKAFSQSSTIHESLGRFSEVIGQGFEFLQYAEGNHAEINRLKQEFLQDQILSKNTYEYKESMLDIVKASFNDPKFALYRTQYAQHEQSVRYMHNYMKRFLPAARRLWNKEITDDEFWAEVNLK